MCLDKEVLHEFNGAHLKMFTNSIEDLSLIGGDFEDFSQL